MRTVDFELLVRFVEELSKLNVPIVFRGAVVLKTAIAGAAVQTNRMTQDVDVDWVGGSVSMQQLFNLVYSAVANMNMGLGVKVSREFNETSSAGFDIIDVTGKPKFKVDLEVASNQQPFCCPYVTMNGVQFYGSTPQKMFSDKLNGISKRSVMWRTKDIYDLYLLSALTGYRLLDVIAIPNSIGQFSEFLRNKEDLRHAYSKMRNISNKPDFDALYSRVYTFVEPFIRGVVDNLVWNGYSWVRS